VRLQIAAPSHTWRGEKRKWPTQVLSRRNVGVSAFSRPSGRTSTLIASSGAAAPGRPGRPDHGVQASRFAGGRQRP